jgi:hypothetical protein
MKQNLPVAIFTFLLLFACSFEISGQRRPSPSPTPSPSGPKAEIATAAGAAAEQAKRLNRFVFILGGIADAIEKVDEERRQGKASSSAIEQNDRNKEAVMQSIRNLRTGIVSLEVDFRSKDSLRPHSSMISGITQMMGTAEDQVGEGKVKDAGRTLLAISEKLIDTLAMLP